MDVLTALEQLARASNQYIVAWKIGSKAYTESFNNYVDAEEYLFTRVPNARECEYRFIAVRDPLG